LFGAARSVRAQIGYARFPVAERAHRAAVTRVADALGDAAERAVTEGAELTWEAALAYARRGRGDRKRPTAGWHALTPTEVEVVRLLAEGLSNREIAGRLFVSGNTVKTHVAHIFDKLGMSTRAEVAAEAARRTV
jgi:DNA-binding CsgD family transcriptional regulator